MSKGITLACPDSDCREIVVRHITENGFETICPHCFKKGKKVPVKIDLGQKLWATISKVVLTLVILSLCFLNYKILNPVNMETVDTNFASDLE